MCTVPSRPKRALDVSFGAGGAATALTRRGSAERTWGAFSCDARSNIAPPRSVVRGFTGVCALGAPEYRCWATRHTKEKKKLQGGAMGTDEVVRALTAARDKQAGELPLRLSTVPLFFLPPHARKGQFYAGKRGSLVPCLAVSIWPAFTISSLSFFLHRAKSSRVPPTGSGIGSLFFLTPSFSSSLQNRGV